MESFSAQRQLQWGRQFGTPEYHRGWALLHAIQLGSGVTEAARLLLSVARLHNNRYARVGNVWLSHGALRNLHRTGHDGEIELQQRRQRLAQVLAIEAQSARADPMRGQNSHDAVFLTLGGERLAALRKLNGHAVPQLDEVNAAVRVAIAQSSALGQQHKQLALTGLDDLLRREGLVREGSLHTTTKECLSLLWGYIEQHTSPAIKAHLVHSLLSHLAELGAEPVCNAGSVQRLLQTPEGIDAQFERASPSESELTERISTLVSDLFNWLEDVQERPELRPTVFADMSTPPTAGDIGRIIGWKQNEIFRSIELVMTGLEGWQLALYEGILSKQLHGVESNQLMMADMTLADLTTDYRNWQGMSALMRAAQINEPDQVHAIMCRGRLPQDVYDELNIATHDGKTAVSYAMKHPDTRVLSMLLRHPMIALEGLKADPETHPLFYACRYGRTGVLNALLVSPFDAVYQRRIDLNVRDAHGNPPLLHAVKSRHRDCVRRLLDHGGCDVNMRGPDGLTALCMAVEQGDTHLVEILLTHANSKDAINVNRPGDDHKTPLRIAYETRQDAVIPLLLSKPEATTGNPLDDAFLRAIYAESSLQEPQSKRLRVDAAGLPKRAESFGV